MTDFINKTFVDYQLEQSIASRLAEVEWTTDQQKYMQALTFDLRITSTDVSNQFLDKLRTACQLWDVDLRIQNISSHRKVIGPVIVAAKKAIAPMIKFFLKDFIRQQKDFNAAILALIIESKNKPQP